MPHCVACANLPGQLWFHPFFTKRRLHPSEQSGGASSPPDAFATYDIRAAALPGNPYDGHTLGTVIPHMQALIGNVLDRCITDAGYRRHNACPITSSRSTPPGQKSRVTPQIKREFKRRTPSSPSSATSRERHRMGRNHLANAVLAAAGYNFRRLPAWIDVFRSRSAPLP
jgi:hypothetical protein